MNDRQTEYRKVIYSNYFTQQSSRFTGTDEGAFRKWEAAHLRREIVPLIPAAKNSSILEIGCGSGTLLGTLKQHGYHSVTGIDLSEEQIRKAHRAGITEAVVADAFDFLKTKPNHFDCIILLDVVEHFTKTELVELLSLIFQALKPGGSVIARTMNMDSPIASVFAFGDFSHDVFLNKSSATQLFIACGLSRIEVLPGYISSTNIVKAFFQNWFWAAMWVQRRLWLFASGMSSQHVLLSPNLIVRAFRN